MKNKSIKQSWPRSARLTVLILIGMWLATALFAFVLYSKYEAEAEANRMLLEPPLVIPEI